MKKRLFILNSPYLGGAERSFIHQIKLGLKGTSEEIKFLIPSLDKGDTDKIENFIKLNIPHAKILTLSYPKSLFQISRSIKNPLSLFVLMQLGLLIFKLRRIIKDQDLLWCNGNKIAFPFYLCARFFSFKGHFVWHFRDYPIDTGIFKIIWKLISGESFKLTFIGNSNDVVQELVQMTKRKVGVKRIYNPVGEKITKKETKEIKVISSVSMLAPWKGIHDLIHMVNVYEKGLIDLGVEEVRIYGAQIYQTAGGHEGYDKDLFKLKKSKLIQFMGLESPKKIFSETDLLVHSALKKEPFGRILLEAFKANIPVVSTGLGGAGEIVENEKTGLIYRPHHYHELFVQIEKIMQDQSLREKLQMCALNRCIEIESTIEDSVKEVLSRGN
ncbi:MAG: glycosyltransferase family 4 protein [Bacteriovoracaceae bacterium]